MTNGILYDLQIHQLIAHPTDHKSVHILYFPSFPIGSNTANPNCSQNHEPNLYYMFLAASYFRNILVAQSDLARTGHNSWGIYQDLE